MLRRHQGLLRYSNYIFSWNEQTVKQNKGGVLMEQQQESSLAKNTLDRIPSPDQTARRITALVKEGGKVTGYQLSDDSVLEKEQAIQLSLIHI